MIRFVLTLALAVAPALAQAQSSTQDSHSGMQHEMHGVDPDVPSGAPREPGQSAFAAIQEIVAILDADPQTDWRKADLPALRRHLIDMNNVTLSAQVEATPIADGFRFTVTGDGEVATSIRRMVTAHAATMSGIRGFSYETEDTGNGAIMTVHAADKADLPMLAGLGFVGVMTLGAHHQEHHLAIASGRSPHE
ncbi:hypothetical protein [Roseibium sp.]|uniref:hypothetical protein n=1 Tax=Roseibium sp. TaxID=1936156 RepID=UPI003D0A5231